jgi:type II secretory pathway pseudopilin PulG
MRIRARHSVGTAFTLIEIMVAVTLLAVITLGLLAMFYQTQRAFRLGANQVDILESGRATMQLMNQDLQQVYPSYLVNVLNFKAATNGLGRLDMVLPVGWKTNQLEDIAFLARRGNEWLGITYRIDHQNKGAGTLYRSVIVTNPAIQDPFTAREWYVVSNLAYTAMWNVPTTNFHRIADGVVHLSVKAFNEQGQLYMEGRQYYEFLATNTITTGYQFLDRAPAYLDLELGILDPKALKQFEARPNALTARSYLTNQAYRVHVFSQRIALRTHRQTFEEFDQW